MSVAVCSSHEFTFSGSRCGSRQLFYQLPRAGATDSAALGNAAVNQLLANS